MDPLSVTASIIAVLQLTVKIIDGLKHARDASTDRVQFTTEIQNLRDLLVALLSRVDEGSSDPWHTNVRQMGGKDGLIYQYRVALEQLKDKISTGEGLKKTAKTFLWKYIQQDAERILSRMERLNSLVQIALEMDHFKLSQAIESRVSSLQDDSKTIQLGIEAIQQGQDRQNQVHDLQKHYEIMEWLSSDNFTAQQSDLITRKQADTGQWFLDSREFTEWVNGTSQTLFCPGIPGAGKTMMAAIAVDHLQNAIQTTDIGIAYLYCNYKRQADQTAPNLLAAIIKQLVQDRPSIAQSLLSMYERHRVRGTRPPFEELSSVLQSVLANYSKVYVVLDALDECPEQNGTRSQLLGICRDLQQQTGLRLMATSRHIPDIVDEFKDTPLVEVRASNSDLKRFVTGNVNRFAKFVRLSSDLQERVQTKIVETADGMFLLASLHVDSLVSKKTTTKLKSALENLSHGSGALGDAYNKAIDRIDGQEHDNCTLAKQVLSWISYARRPLTTQELCHALAVEIGDEDFDSENVTDVEDILSVCAGLVTVDEESQIIRLVHYTTQEYLEGIREDWHPKAQQEIASTCLTYLCFEPFRSAPCPDFDKFKSRRKAYSFLDYSARYWRDHVSAVQEDICELAMALLQDSNLVSYAYLHECEGHYEPLRGMTGLHLTASFGLLHLFKELLSWAKEENMDLANSQDTWGATPLFCAVENGHEEIVTLLLGNEKVDVNVQDEHGRTSLIMAIQTERKDIAELLINTGKVDVDSNIGDWMPLSSAVACGQKEIVELLLCTGKVDVNEKCSGWTPLFLAVRKGHKEIVELLLGLEKADVNKTPNRMALLRYAVEKGYKDFVEFLLGISTDASKMTDRWPLLALIAANRHRGVAELLGSEEIDLDAKGDNYNTTLLMVAAQRGHGDLVELLLNAGAEIHAKGHSGSTALMEAVEHDQEEIVELLLDRGADIHGRSEKGSTLLMLPIYWDVKFMVELLLKKGADVHAKDKDGSTALIVAAHWSHKDIAGLLLDRGADVNARDKEGLTALIVAARQGHKNLAELLLDRGADVHAKDRDGSTALIIAARRGKKGVVKLLLSAGADVQAKNNKGSTALILAAHWNRRKTAELLLDRGADVHARDKEGLTALTWAEKKGHTNIADLLRAHMSRL